MLKAADGLPMNLGFLGKGNASLPAALEEQIRAGAMGLKLHEDWGTTPAAIDCCLSVAERFDVQVAIHTEHAQRIRFVEDTFSAFKGRTIPRLSQRGRRRRARPGHHPRVRRAQRAAVFDEPDASVHGQHDRRALDMLMVCHHLDPSIPEDVAFAESRIRRETIAAEDILHDLGAFSMISSDSQAMGRVGRGRHSAPGRPHTR